MSKVNVQIKAVNKSNTIVGSDKIIYSPADPKSGIQYADNYGTAWTGQNISYITGDEGWRWQNGEFDNFVVENPQKIAVLDNSSPDPFNTLKNLNIFGNKNRFTAPDGSQNYIELTSITIGIRPWFMIIDHLFGCAYIIYKDSNVTTSGMFQFSEAFAAGQAVNEHGFSNFSIMSTKEIQRLTNISSNSRDQALNYNPFNLTFVTHILSCTVADIRFPTNYLNQIYLQRNILLNGTQGTTTFARHFFFVKNIQQELQP